MQGASSGILRFKTKDAADENLKKADDSGNVSVSGVPAKVEKLEGAHSRHLLHFLLVPLLALIFNNGACQSRSAASCSGGPHDSGISGPEGRRRGWSHSCMHESTRRLPRVHEHLISLHFTRLAQLQGRRRWTSTSVQRQQGRQRPSAATITATAGRRGFAAAAAAVVEAAAADVGAGVESAVAGDLLYLSAVWLAASPYKRMRGAAILKALSRTEKWQNVVC